MHTMPAKRAHILLPEDLLREIDSLVGPRGRNAFLVETARSEVRRQKLLQFLEGKDPTGNAPTAARKSARLRIRNTKLGSVSKAPAG